jgi:hypothetical protein
MKKATPCHATTTKHSRMETTSMSSWRPKCTASVFRAAASAASAERSWSV